ncbi:hypothetical protein [Spirosoma pomorum]|jgi:hypothetical protein
MKITHALSLTAMGLFLAGTVSLAQTPTESSAASVGATKDGSMSTQYTDKNQDGKKKKKNKDRMNGKMTTGQINEEKRLYRESSSSDGTSINNSNTTNYNSNNVTTAPTGVGSVPTPATTGTKSTTQP